MLRFTVLFALVALSVAWPSSSEEMDSKMDGPGKMSGEYKKWKMMEEKDKEISHYESFKKFLMFKDKLEKMEEMAKKKAVYQDFLKFKAYKEKMEGHKQNKMDDWNSMEREDEGDEAMDKKEHEKKFEMMIKSFNDDSKKHVMAITSAFLKICKCQNAAGLELAELFEKHEGKKDDGMGDMFSMEEPDFNGNMTAKANFVMKLEPEQKQKMMIHGLVKSMCGGAKTFINHAKEFKEKYMKSPEGKN